MDDASAALPLHEHVRLLRALPAPREAHAYLRPRPAATLILLDRAGSEPTVLMGRRNPALAFMPGKFVFPGGRIEPGDRKMNVAGALPEAVSEKINLRRGARAPDVARPLALAAIRETFEETGLLLGTKEFGAPDSPPPGAWTAFAARGVYPTLETVHFLARAITPPGRPRRFDATFLAIDVEAIVDQVEGVVSPQAELVEIARVPLSEALKLDLPLITSVVLRDLRARIDGGMAHWLPVPLYREANGLWVREEL
jgi:8-oxo-dGTP pyrophosphatase MutT (NUDIX family)